MVRSNVAAVPSSSIWFIPACIPKVADIPSDPKSPLVFIFFSIIILLFCCSQPEKVSWGLATESSEATFHDISQKLKHFWELLWPNCSSASDGRGRRVEGCWLTSAVREAVEDVAFVAVALEAAGGVDAEVVAGSVERALVDVCPGRGTGQAVSSFSNCSPK